MATSPVPELNPVVPHTLRAQLTAQLDAQRDVERADETVAASAKLAGEPPSGVLLHKCFSQVDQQPKPDDCDCERIPYDQAIELVRAGKADWYVARRGGKPYRSQQIAVWRATAAEVREYEIRRREDQPKRLAEQEARQWAEEFRAIEQECVDRVRNIIVAAVELTKLERRYAQLTDTEYRWMLRDPEHWRAELGTNVFRQLLSVASRYWERLLTFFGLSEDAGRYMSFGGNLMHTGDYKLEAIDAHQNATWGDGPAGEPRALAQPSRPSGADPKRDLLDDEWDKAVAMANYGDRVQEMADKFEKELIKAYKQDQNVVLGYGGSNGRDE